MSLDLPLMDDFLEETHSIKHSPETVEDAPEERPQLDSPNQLFPIPTGESQGATLLHHGYIVLLLCYSSNWNYITNYSHLLIVVVCLQMNL